jgi:hypothetical protein
MLPESDLSQSSAADCGTNRILNPRGSVRPSGVDRAWEIQSEHNDKSSFLVHLLPPHSHSHTTTFSSSPQARTSYFR